MESQRKRPRADEKGGTKKRGRPRKTELTQEASVIQEEAADSKEAPAVVVVPEPAGIIPDQTSGYFTPLLSVGGDTLESQPAAAIAEPALMSVLGSVQSPVFAPALTSPVNPIPAVVSPSIPAKSVNTAPVPASDAVQLPALSQAGVPDVAPAPLLVETLYTESQGREVLDQVLIEDLGPDEEEDISASQEERADEGTKEKYNVIKILRNNFCCEFLLVCSNVLFS